MFLQIYSYVFYSFFFVFCCCFFLGGVAFFFFVFFLWFFFVFLLPRIAEDILYLVWHFIYLVASLYLHLPLGRGLFHLL